VGIIGQNVKMKMIIIIMLLMLIILLATYVYAPQFSDDTDSNFDLGTFFKTKTNGTGSGASVILNITDNAFQKHEKNGNFTSQEFDTTSTTSVFDKIAWTEDLRNSSDVMGYVTDSVSNDIGVFYRNGTVRSDTNVGSTSEDIGFTGVGIKYTFPADFSYDDILGFGGDDDASDRIGLFFINGTVLATGDLGGTWFDVDISFTSYNTWSIPAGWNVSDIIDFYIHGGQTQAGVFFKNGSYIRDVDDENPPYIFDTVSAWSTTPSGFDENDAIGFLIYRGGNGVAMIYKNGSHIAQATSNIKNGVTFAFDSVFTDTYSSDVNLTTYTNITLQTRVGNTSGSLGAWSDVYDNPNGSETIQDTVAQFIQYKAIFKTTDPYVTPFLLNVSINYTVGVTDTCTYTSGDWDVTITDNCVINSAVTGDSGKCIIFTGDSGSFTTNAIIDGFSCVDYLTTNSLYACNAGGIVC